MKILFKGIKFNLCMGSLVKKLDSLTFDYIDIKNQTDLEFYHKKILVLEEKINVCSSSHNADGFLFKDKKYISVFKTWLHLHSAIHHIVSKKFHMAEKDINLVDFDWGTFPGVVKAIIKELIVNREYIKSMSQKDNHMPLIKSETRLSSLIEKIKENKFQDSLTSAFKAIAYYELAYLSYVRGNINFSKTCLEKIKQIKYGGFFINKETINKNSFVFHSFYPTDFIEMSKNLVPERKLIFNVAKLRRFGFA